MKEKIGSFKELIGHIFYDWGFTANPQIKSFKTGGFWINKTSIISHETQYSLEYKTSSYSISNKTMKSFNEFYVHLYLNDDEFELFLNFLENSWNWDCEIVVNQDKLMVDTKVLGEFFNKKLTIHGHEFNFDTSKKILRFINLINNS